MFKAIYRNTKVNFLLEILKIYKNDCLNAKKDYEWRQGALNIFFYIIQNFSVYCDHLTPPIICKKNRIRGECLSLFLALADPYTYPAGLFCTSLNLT